MKKTKALLGVLTLALAAGSLAAQPNACVRKVQIQSKFSMFEMEIPLTRGGESSIPKNMRQGVTIRFEAPMFLCFASNEKFSGISYVRPPLGELAKAPTPANRVWDWASAAELSANGYHLSDWSLCGRHDYVLAGKGRRLSFDDGTAYSVLFGVSINHWYQRELKQRQAAEAMAKRARKAIPNLSKVSFD